jgi:Fe-S cluster assembly protein SufB
VSTDTDVGAELEQYKWGFSKPENYVFKSRKGLSHEIVEEISQMKGEPQWMRDFRHRSLDIFLKKPMPTWGGDLSAIDFDDIYYYIKPTQQAGRTWDDLPAEIKDTFEQLGIPEAERKYLAGVGAQYECLSGDARVYAARGLVPIREIEPGDTVFSFDEETNGVIPAKVRATAEKGERDVFEVKVGTRAIKATANHPFLALTYAKAEDRQRGRYTREWKYLQDLAVGDLVAVTKVLPDTGAEYDVKQPEVELTHRHNVVTLPEYTTEDLMWWLGLYIGDGFIHYAAGADKARVEFAIPDSDPAVRAELIRVTETLFGITPTDGDPYRLTINSTVVARFLEINGFTGKALEKRVPQWVFGVPEAQKLAFLGGYLDSDGYVRDGEKNHDVVLTSGNRELLRDMTELLSMCGLPSSEIHRFESRHPSEAGRMVIGYRVEVAGPFERIASRSPRRLERMNKRKYHHDYSSAHGTYFQRHTTEFHGYAKIEAITPAGTEMVYDIEIDGPHNFVAEGLIVHNSEVIYHKVREDLEKQGVIFVDPGTGLREHEELFRKYFATVIPPNDNKFAALNSAVWSGGSFIYVPKGVRVEIPLQAYFRINAQNMGQFERTLIIADEDSYVHYVEGCFLAGARVRTRDGEKLIEEIHEGDEVLTHKGRYRRVYHTMERPYHGTIYHVGFYGDSWRKLHITEEHPLLVVRRKKAEYRNESYRPEWLPVSEVKPGDYLLIPVPQPEKPTDTSHTITIPLGRGRHDPVMRDVTLPLDADFFRLVGYYHAEGHVDNEHYLTFSFHVDETELLEDTRDLIERYLGKPAIENKPRQNGQTLVVASTEMARAFARTFGSTVHNKRVPDFIQHAPRTHLAQWVRGIWCGDGSYDARKNMFRFNTVSPDLAYAFRDALLRLGIAASLNLQERSAPRRPMYVVVISSPWNEQFGDIVGYPAPGGKKEGSPFALDEQYLYVPIRSIEIEEMDTTVYNFSVEEDESYVAEGVVSHNCTAPTYTTDSLHSAVVEIIVLKNARVRYTTIQNWSKNVYNLVTKRATAYEGATMEWVDGNLGSKLTMKYPAVWLMEPHARGEVLSVAFASDGQHQDAGGKVVHVAPNTSSQIISKSISKGTGRSSYRGLLKVQKGAHDVKSNVRCDALLLDETSRTDTYPYIEIEEEDVEIGHEATVSKVGEEQLFYLMSRGLTEAEAYTMVVSGFIEPIAKELPLEYAVELNRLIQLEMAGSVG